MKKNQWKNNILWLFFVGFFLLMANGCSQPAAEKTTQLPYIGHHDIVYEETESHKIGDTIFHKVPEWHYLTADSTWLSSEELTNKIWITDFFFSYCPTICVPMNQEMKKLREKLTNLVDEVVFLSFSIDPERDSPTQLQSYIKKQGFEAPNWYFLTGDKEETHDLAIQGFQVLAGEDELAPGGFLHSSNFVLVDKNRHIRGVYDGLSPEDLEQLIEDVNFLLNND